MQFGWAHLAVVIGSHLIRSWHEDLGQSGLRTEIAGLRLEVHRARTLVDDYVTVLDSCRADSESLRSNHSIVGWINICFGFCLVALWIKLYYWDRLAISRNRAVHTKEPPADTEPIVTAIATKEITARCVRPSDLRKAQSA